MWARKAGCPIKNEPLGSDYDGAVRRAEEVLLKAFDSWRTGGATDLVPVGPTVGTLDWLFSEYRADRRYTRLDVRTRRNHEVGFRLVGGYVLKDGGRLGDVRLASVVAAVVDAVYDKLLFVTETDADGNQVERERRTTINHAMKTCRRAWNVVARRHGSKVPANPFSAMGLKSSDRETPTATYDELQAFRAKAVELNLSSIATAALVGWEWLQREKHIFGAFDVSHYRPKEQPSLVRVLHPKNGTEAWIPLFDEAGCRCIQS
jgi:hypothetical protein